MSGRRTLLRQAGVGLVEVMIALLLSLLTVGVIIQVLLGNHKTYLTGEAIARVQEDSRFAVNLLQQELRMVGYQGCLSKQGVNITNTLNGATRQEFVDDLPVLAVTALLYFLLYPLSRLLARLFSLKGNENHVYSACSMFGNIGFMGIPIVAAVFPEHGMLYIALFTVVDQLLLWTVGVNLTAPTDKENAMSIASRLLKMVNPATIAVTLAVIGIFLDVHLPLPVNTALTKAGALTTPLAMIYMGGLFCFC